MSEILLKTLPHYTRLRQIYALMKTRCYNVHSPNYKYYGGRGVTVCDEWKNDFKAFYDWAITHGYADDLSIDREKINGEYSPKNCRWVTRKVQGNNKSNNVLLTLNGETHTLPEWSTITGLKQYVIRNRLKRNWSVSDALGREVGKYVYKV